MSELYVNNNIAFRSSFYERFFKSLPQKEIKNSVRYNKLGHALASPHWNRAALGVAAISTQPAMDYFNPRVDRDTATASALRTVAKICVCTSVGFAVRGGTYKLVEKYAHGTSKEGSTVLTPDAILKMADKRLRDNSLKLHKNALSTSIALGIMLFTNFLLDAPLTTIAANQLISKYNEYKDRKGEKVGGLNA